MLPAASRCFPLRLGSKDVNLCVWAPGAVGRACCAVKLCKSLPIHAESLLIDCKSFLVASRCFPTPSRAFPWFLVVSRYGPAASRVRLSVIRWSAPPAPMARPWDLMRLVLHVKRETWRIRTLIINLSTLLVRFCPSVPATYNYVSVLACSI